MASKATSVKKNVTHERPGVMAVLRDWGDALIVAFVLAMFLRVFVLELFKIPTGSMTPTLIGGMVAHADYNGDGGEDLVLFSSPADRTPLVFVRNDGYWEGLGRQSVSLNKARQWEYDGKLKHQFDRILVNKMAYWFEPPERGDIVVFKVPPRIWQEDKPIYIKRCVGEPGDRLSFDPDGRLVAGGDMVETPEFFSHQRYRQTLERSPQLIVRPENHYRDLSRYTTQLETVDVPEDAIVAFGDNTNSSWDSRYWGSIPLPNVRGRAFFRYVPLNQMKFLK